MPFEEEIMVVEHWLGESLGKEVDSFWVSERGVAVFRVDSDHRGGNPELEISREAFEDHAIEQIVADLEEQEVMHVLSEDPTMRLSYTTDRSVPHFERMTIRVDGRRYRITRDTNHSVRIFDDSDRLLENWPQQPTDIDVSIFRRPRQRWEEDIRNWRGPDQ